MKLQTVWWCDADSYVSMFPQNDSNMSRTALFALLVKQEFDVWDDAIKGKHLKVQLLFCI